MCTVLLRIVSPWHPTMVARVTSYLRCWLGKGCVLLKQTDPVLTSLEGVVTAPDCACMGFVAQVPWCVSSNTLKNSLLRSKALRARRFSTNHLALTCLALCGLEAGELEASL